MANADANADANATTNANVNARVATPRKDDNGADDETANVGGHGHGHGEDRDTTGKIGGGGDVEGDQKQQPPMVNVRDTSAASGV
ncbi:hypothetical protein FRC20_007917 [Serendipita sp. 405]|nr:hypothetical protein FRC20_007917 [Serendipita sp. 405]